MKRYVVDTNVPVVANGRPDPGDLRPPSVGCRESSIKFLQAVLLSGQVLVDLDGEIQREYRTYLNPNGQPGVGDRFYLEVLNSAPRRIERIELPKVESGEYADLPQTLVDAGFDRADRKFAALAMRAGAPVINAIDSDWLNHRATIENAGIEIRFLCGSDAERWFAA